MAHNPLVIHQGEVHLDTAGERGIHDITLVNWEQVFHLHRHLKLRRRCSVVTVSGSARAGESVGLTPSSQ